MKKIIALVFAMVLALSVLSVSAFAEESTELTEITEIHIHFSEGITEIPRPVKDAPVRENIYFVCDEEDVGIIAQSDNLKCIVRLSSGAAPEGIYKPRENYWDYIYLYAKSGYKFSEDSSKITFTDQDVAEALKDFEVCYNYGYLIILARGTMTEPEDIGYFEISYNSSLPNPKAGDIIEDFDWDYEIGEEYKGMVAPYNLNYYDLYKVDAEGNEFDCNFGDTYEEGYTYYQTTYFWGKGDYGFNRNTTLDDIPDIEGLKKEIVEPINLWGIDVSYVVISYTREIYIPAEQEENDKPNNPEPEEYKDTIVINADTNKTEIEYEENPNTGAPVFMGYAAVIAAVAIAGKRK